MRVLRPFLWAAVLAATFLYVTSVANWDMGRVLQRTFSTLGADLPTFGLLALIFAAAPMALQGWLQFQTFSATTTGRPLAAKIAATLSSLVASPPSPYTVSVGNATSWPARSSAAA